MIHVKEREKFQVRSEILIYMGGEKRGMRRFCEFFLFGISEGAKRGNLIIQDCW